MARKGFNTERETDKDQYFGRFLNSEILRWAYDDKEQLNPVLEGEAR